jgi:glutamine amidotransferase
MGNLRSVEKALEHVGGKAQEIGVTHSKEIIGNADRIVFPGQGAIGNCMQRLRDLDLLDAVRAGLEARPFLGICIGLQALLESSEEDGGTMGLGCFPGAVRRFALDMTEDRTGERLKIPHMGWNQVHFAREHPLWAGISDGARFYFVHSFYAMPQARELTAGETTYGITFASAVAHSNVFAVQFHPEKSQQAGLKLLSNFLRWNPPHP